MLGENRWAESNEEKKYTREPSKIFKPYTITDNLMRETFEMQLPNEVPAFLTH